MTDLVLGADLYGTLTSQLLGGEVESCAVMFASEVSRSDKRRRLLAREVVFPEASRYVLRTSGRAELEPAFVAAVTKRAFREGYATVWVHSHLGADRPNFSFTDDEGEAVLSKFLRVRIPNVDHAALVISEGGVSCRQLGGGSQIAVIVQGTDRVVLYPSGASDGSDVIYDRQVRAFGPHAQELLQSLTVGIVGLGGTGSIVAQELAHLGVRQFLLIDPDVVERSNLNRIAGASLQAIGRHKVLVAEDLIKSISPSADVVAVRGDVTRTSVALKLTDCDFIFGCTDSHGSRSVIQQISYQYLIPAIDLGSTIIVEGGSIKHVIGRVQLLSPTFACLTCGKLLDPEQVRRDMMNEFERQVDPYIQGHREPAPAVMSLNGIISSLAVSMMLSVCVGFPAPGRHLLYDGRRSSLRSVRVEADLTCYICSSIGSYARGDSWPIFARQGDDGAN